MSVIALERELEAEMTQLVFEGWPEPETRFFTLRSARNLPTGAKLFADQHVSGRFEGVVDPKVTRERRNGEWVDVYFINVLEGTLD